MHIYTEVYVKERYFNFKKKKKQ